MIYEFSQLKHVCYLEEMFIKMFSYLLPLLLRSLLKVLRKKGDVIIPVLES